MTEIKKLNSVIGHIKTENKEIKRSITPPIVPRNCKMLKTYL
jgi:hypothetical protein